MFSFFLRSSVFLFFISPFFFVFSFASFSFSHFPSRLVGFFSFFQHFVFCCNLLNSLFFFLENNFLLRWALLWGLRSEKRLFQSSRMVHESCWKRELYRSIQHWYTSPENSVFLILFFSFLFLDLFSCSFFFYSLIFFFCFLDLSSFFWTFVLSLVFFPPFFCLFLLRCAFPLFFSSSFLEINFFFLRSYLLWGIRSRTRLRESHVMVGESCWKREFKRWMQYR